MEIKDYLSPGDPWFPLGTTPLDHVKIPNGYLRWRVSKAGVGEFTAAPVTDDIHGFLREFNFPLDAAVGSSARNGSACRPARLSARLVAGSPRTLRFPNRSISTDSKLPTGNIRSLSTRADTRSANTGRRSFIRDGKELSWEQAMDLFRDSSGRPGPSTWEAGHYPAGQADYPVGGVSWYEASAYAEFAGKSLPVIAQWYLAAPSSVAKYIMAQSNFSAASAPAGKYQGIGPLGTYDMAGNVAEWCRNESGGGARYQLGGGFNTSPSEYFEPGKGCRRFIAPPMPASAACGIPPRYPRKPPPSGRQTIRDFSKAKPAADAVLPNLQDHVRYDRTPLNAKLESVVQDSPDWRKEKITFDAAYGKERDDGVSVPARPCAAALSNRRLFSQRRVLDAPR